MVGVCGCLLGYPDDDWPEASLEQEPKPCANSGGRVVTVLSQGWSHGAEVKSEDVPFTVAIGPMLFRNL